MDPREVLVFGGLPDEPKQVLIATHDFEANTWTAMWPINFATYKVEVSHWLELPGPPV